MIARALLLVVLFVSAARAQVFDINAGQSTLYDSTGGSATVYLPNQTAFLSAGISQGQFRTAIRDTFLFHNWQVTAGDQLFSFSACSAGLGIAARGVSIGRTNAKQTVQFFAGQTGDYFSAPYFAGFGAQTPGGGVFYQRNFHSGDFATLEVIAGRKRTALQAANWKWRGLHLQGTGGLLENARYLNAEADWHGRWASVTGTHNDFVLSNQSVVANSFGAAAFHGPVSGYISAFHAQGRLSESAGAGLHMGPLSVSESWARTPGEPAIIVTSVAENFRHWYFSQTISGRNSVGIGGGYHNNRISVSVDHSILFNLLTGAFEQSETATLQLRVKDSAISLGGYLDSTRRARYTAAAEDYVGQMAAGSVNEHPARRIKGKFFITGQCVDSDGQPVSGCALIVGSQPVYADDSGAFSVRVVTGKPVAVAVDLADFAAPGRFRVITCPASAQPGAPIRVVVSR